MPDVFVGREGPLRRLLAAMDDAVAGHAVWSW
jgi:hypothetical protein